MAESCSPAKSVSDIAKNLAFTPSRNTKSPSPVKPNKSSIDPSIKKKTADLVIDLHGFVQKWETLNQASFQTLTSLASTFAHLQSSEVECKTEGLLISSECWKNYKVKLIKLHESLMKDHSDHMEKFNEIHSKMENIVTNLEAIDLLNDNNASDNSSLLITESILFWTWTANDFYKVSRSILNCYTKEWLLKQELSKALTKRDSTNNDSSNSSLYISMWLQQPYLTEEAELKLENLLIECGLK